MLEQIPGNENYGDEYIYSSFFMFTETKRMLENGLARLTNLRAKFAHLWTMYSGALKIKPEIIINEPRPSHVFLSVPQYNRIFVQIHKWFQFGIYDFTKENGILNGTRVNYPVDKTTFDKVKFGMWAKVKFEASQYGKEKDLNIKPLAFALIESK